MPSGPNFDRKVLTVKAFLCLSILYKKFLNGHIA